MDDILTRLSDVGIREQVPDDELAKLRKYDDDVDAIVDTVQARYDDSPHSEIFGISEVGLVRGHFLLRDGYDTVEKIATLSEPELKQVNYIGETSAPKILDSARRLLAEPSPNNVEWQYVYLDTDSSLDRLRSRLASLSITSETVRLVIDGYDTSIPEEKIRQMAEPLAPSVQLRDQRRNKLEEDLDELKCIAAEFTYRILNHSTSIPSWLTGTHYLRTIKPTSKYEHYEALHVLGLYRYQPVTKNPDQRSLRLYRFAKGNESDKGIPKAVADMICRRFLRAADDYDIVVPFPSVASIMICWI